MVVETAYGARTFEISDAEYDNLEFGSSYDDSFWLTTADGRFYRFNWTHVDYVQTLNGAPPSPSTYPVWRFTTEHVDVVVDDSTKDALVVALATDVNSLVEFNTVQGHDVKFMLANEYVITIEPASLTIPTPP
jgi:hypothetical protein